MATGSEFAAILRDGRTQDRVRPLQDEAQRRLEAEAELTAWSA